MDWVLDFYKKQHEWTKAYRGKPGQYEKEKVLKIKERAGEPPRDVLELGAGGGQFAYACAEEGYNVVALELVPELAQQIKTLGEKLKGNNLQVIRGDFFEVQIKEKFDVVCYWDGFGIGEDLHQKTLLRRIYSWLKKDGLVFLDVYSPWFWAKEAGKEKDFGDCFRKTDFDFKNSRFLDTIWLKKEKAERITQSLRCYSLSDLVLLLEGTGFKIAGINEVAGFNEKTGEYSTQVDFKNAMMYSVILEKT